MVSSLPSSPVAPKFVEHSWSPIMRVGLLPTARALDAQDGSDFWVVGTAAMLGQGFAITARHVIDACTQRFGLRVTGSQSFEMNYSMTAAQFWCDNNDASPELILYDVRTVRTPTLGDLALLGLVQRTENPQRYDNKMPKFSLLPPKLGEQAVAFGYHSGRVEWDRSANAIGTLGQPATAAGNVIDIHLDGRPLVPGPSFMTDARYRGGISGGSVLIDGTIRGLITSSTEDQHGETIYATVSMLWPLMAIEIDCKLPGEDTGTLRTLHDLAAGGWLYIDGWESIEVIRNDVGRPVGARYNAAAQHQ